MPRSNERSLGEVIGEVVKAYGLRGRMDELDVNTIWEEVTGAMIAKHTLGLRLRRGKLIVRVDSAPLRHELSFMKEGLIALLNRRLEREVVKEIVLE